MARVVVVEDDYLIAMQTASIVEDAGYTVIGPEATVDATRKVLAHQKVDLALLDINLGGEMVFPISEMLDTMDIPYHLRHKLPHRCTTCGIRRSAAGTKALYARVVGSAVSGASTIAGRPQGPTAWYQVDACNHVHDSSRLMKIL
jgi:DNA-binding NarL/FixJ family response regulator